MLSTVSLGNVINDFPERDLNMDIKIRRKRNTCKIRTFRSSPRRGTLKQVFLFCPSQEESSVCAGGGSLGIQ